MVNRFEVYLVALDPTVRKEMRKTRPCRIISPDEINRYSSMVIVAPMTSNARPRPIRVQCRFKGKDGVIVLDQLRAVDKSRLVKRLGVMDRNTGIEALLVLSEMFAP